MEIKLRGSYTLRPQDSHENWPHTLALDGRMDVSISGVHGTLAGRREGGDMVGKVGAWHPLHTPTLHSYPLLGLISFRTFCKATDPQQPWCSQTADGNSA